MVEPGNNWEQDQGLLETLWNENMGPLDPKMVEELLSREDFGRKIVESIFKTEHPPKAQSCLDYQEFGFVGYRYIGQVDDKFYISPLFEGDEKSINLYLQSEEWAATQSDFPPSISFNYHTHPSHSKEEKIASLFLKGLPMHPSYISVCFSKADLRGSQSIAQEGDHSMIFAVGIANQDPKTGKLILASFREFQAFANLNPKDVTRKLDEYQHTPGKDYFDAYRESGLNLAVLNVDLRGPLPLNPEEIAQASKVLAQRVY